MENEISLQAHTHLTTEFGDFELLLFNTGKNQLPCLKLGDLDETCNPLIRIHSECKTGDVFHSIECDCYEQLMLSMRMIQRDGQGMIIYLPQEGRGHGLATKIQIYELMRKGFDTVNACKYLGIPIDIREYDEAVKILRFYSISNLRLLTNNPIKLNVLRNHGFNVQHISLIPTPRSTNEQYLNTKSQKLGHLMSFEVTPSKKGVTDDSENMIKAVLANYPNLYLQKPLEIFPLASYANQVWLLSTDDSFVVLKRYLREPLVPLVQQHQLLDEVQHKGIRSPSLIANAQGSTVTFHEGQRYVLSKFIPHIPLDYSVQEVPDVLIEQVAGQLARIHSISHDELSVNIPSQPVRVEHEVSLLISQFEEAFHELANSITSDEFVRLKTLFTFVTRAKEEISRFGNISKLGFEDAPSSLTHGDFSFDNILIDNVGGLFLIDWDQAAIRPRIWELHKAILLTCSIGNYNAYINPIDFNKAFIFMKTYTNILRVNAEEKNALRILAEYMSKIYWLKFTLSSVLQRDFRILSKVPANIENCYWWSDNLEIYEQLIKSNQ